MLKPLVQLRQALQDESGTLLAFLGIQGVQVEHLGFQHQRVGGSEQLRQGGLHCELVLVTQQKGRRQAQLFEALTADTEAQVLDRAGDLRTLGARRRTGGTLATQWRNRALNPLELLLQAFGGLDVAQTEAQIANAPSEIQASSRASSSGRRRATSEFHGPRRESVVAGGWAGSAERSGDLRGRGTGNERDGSWGSTSS